jgi:hypothetical protein
MECVSATTARGTAAHAVACHERARKSERDGATAASAYESQYDRGSGAGTLGVGCRCSARFACRARARSANAVGQGGSGSGAAAGKSASIGLAFESFSRYTIWLDSKR